MSWRDRDYNRQDSSSFGAAGRSIGLPKPTPYVKILLIVNIAIFILTCLDGRDVIKSWGVLLGANGLENFVQPWRFITYQFLHAGTTHILMNMLGLYFMGPPLERFWGSKKFLTFYLLCGCAAGLVFVIMSGLFHNSSPLLGASGAILGLLSACAVLFPQMVLILFVFPVPIRFAAGLFTVFYFFNVLSERNLSDACHLGGMVAGFLYVAAGPWLNSLRQKQDNAKWRQLLETEDDDQKRVDEILDKVHKHGIQSLSWQERRTLKNITQRQKQRDDFRKR